jgi:CubicO group peptidase (beta-lactamase class C family)
MKKLLGILVLGLLWSNITFASSNSFVHFNKWLYDNGHHQYLNLDEETNNLKINIYKGRWSAPFKANPNKDTLIYYLYKYLDGHHTGDPSTKQWGKYEIQPSKSPYEFKSDLREDKFVKNQMQKKPLLSYLLFENDKIVIDEISPKDKFGEFVDNTTKFRANSMGKSLVSYVAGHAICAGYIDSVDSKIDDWPLLKGTLYDGQKLIDILNMTAGDQEYIYDSEFLLTGTEADDKSIGYYMEWMMQGTKKSKPRYNYNVMNTNIIFNYVQYKSKDKFESLLNDIFQKKVRIKDSVYFFKAAGPNSQFFATRYDYLRISKAILDDWQNDTCVGKYLKEIYDRRIPKKLGNHDGDRGEPRLNRHYTYYGGQFHFPKKKIVFGMSGWGGQAIAIGVETSTIVVINSIHYNHDRYQYSHGKLLVKPFKKK